MKQSFFVFVFVIAAFFLVGCSSTDDALTGQAVHGTYGAFSAPEHGFRVGNGLVLASDTVVYKTAWYSIDGASWQQLSLSGNAYGSSSSWLSGAASASLPASLSGPGEHYVIVYTCSSSSGSWDCHGSTPASGGWQLLIINASASCLDSCSSLGYQCGVQTLCGVNVDCGGCDFGGYERGQVCVAGACAPIPSGKTYYVATTGSDGNPGTISKPLATLQQAVFLAGPGDTVYVRGGTYFPTATIEWHPRDGLGFDGTPEAPVRFLNFPDEQPVFDFINVIPSGNYNSGFSILGADYVHLRGLTVKNVKQTRDNVECLGIYAGDSTNLVFENVVIHNVDGNAFRFFGSWRYPASGYPTDSWYDASQTGYLYPEHATYPEDTTYFINCDAYNNWDWRPRVPGATLGGAADGFKTVNEPGSTIVFDGCRAWNNSDDGFDPGATYMIIINNSWSFQNGALDGDGTGFKTGGVRNSTPLLRMVTNTIAANNTQAGYFLLEYFDYNRTNARFYNNLAYGSGSSGFFPSINEQYPNPIAVWKNNIAYKNAGLPFSNAYMIYEESHNTWKWVPGYPGYVQAFSLTDADFVSLDVSQLKRPRKEDGSLPDITFGHLAPGSVLIDAGIDVGLPYSGDAPDIGAFEYRTGATPGSACVGPSARPCALENAYGQETRTCVVGSWSSWGACVFVSCDEGYIRRDGQCVLGPGWSGELLENGGFEGGLAGWTVSAGGWTTGSYQSYGANSHPPQAGHYCAYVTSSSSDAYLYKDVSLAGFASLIDAGLVVANVSGWGISSIHVGGLTKIRFVFLDESKAVISTPLETGYVDNPAWWEAKLSEEPVPAGARYVRVWGNTRDRYGYSEAAGDLDSFSVRVRITGEIP